MNKDTLKTKLKKSIEETGKEHGFCQKVIKTYSEQMDKCIDDIYKEDSRKIKENNKNYALRRIIYIILISSDVLLSIKEPKLNKKKVEIFKIFALTMARNLNDFFFPKNEDFFEDDIFYSDFFSDSEEGSPEEDAKICWKTKIRINKISAHIVCSKPVPFTKIREVSDILYPLVESGVEFVNKAIEKQKAKYTGKANEYAKKANKYLTLLKIPTLPEN